MDRLADDFLGGCMALEDELLAVVPQGDHAVLDGFGSEFIGCNVSEDHFAQIVVHDHQFKKSDAAFVAGVVAVIAALASVELLIFDVGLFHPQFVEDFQGWFDLFSAFGADPADQSLGQDGFDRRGDQKGGDPHILHPGNGARSVVGVKGAEDQVPGQGGLDSDFGRLDISDLTHEDHIGILTQDGTQA